MSLASFIQTAVFGPVVLSTEERSPCDGEAAWVSFQQGVQKAKEAARKAHAPVRHIEAAQRSLVHSALGLAASRSIPTQPASGAAANRGAA